jgi:hypothetical protein
MAKPNLIASYPVYSPGTDTSTLTTPAFTPANGEVIVVKLTTWDTGAPMAAPSGGGQTYTANQITAPGGFKGWSATYTCTVSGSPGSFSISAAMPTTATRHSMVVERWGNAVLAVTPAVFTVFTGSGGDMISGFTTTADNSVMSWASVDLNSRDPAGRAYSPLTTVETGLFDGHVGSNSVQYFGYTPVTGIGAYTLSEHVPAGALAWVISGVEIKAASSAGATLFTTNPAGNFTDGSLPGSTFATTVTFDTVGQINAVRFFAHPNVQSTNPTITVEVWRVDGLDDGAPAGTRLSSQAIDGAACVPSVYNTVYLPSPVSVDTSHVYRIAYNATGVSYVATSNFFASSSLVNGHITGLQTRTAPFGGLYNGVFKIGQPPNTYPYDSFSGGAYFVDPAFTASGGGDVIVAANLSANASLAATMVTEARAAAALVANASLTASPVTEARVAAALSANASMVARLSSPSGPVDPIATPVANALLACLTEQMNNLPSPPKYVQLRVGTDTGPLIGPNVDECCAGLAWVRVANVYPSWDSFPSPDYDWLPCGPLAYAVVLEMGSAYCMPWSDSDDSFENIDPPSTADWQTAFTTQQQHQTLMRRAAACCFAPTQRRAVGEWNPLPVEGGCTGGTIRVTVSVMAPCGDC